MNKKANTHNVGKSVRSKTSLAASAFGFVVLFGATACVPPKPIRVDFNVNQNVEVDQKGSTSEEHDSNVEQGESTFNKSDSNFWRSEGAFKNLNETVEQEVVHTSNEGVEDVFTKNEPVSLGGIVGFPDLDPFPHCEEEVKCLLYKEAVGENGMHHRIVSERDLDLFFYRFKVLFEDLPLEVRTNKKYFLDDVRNNPEFCSNGRMGGEIPISPRLGQKLDNALVVGCVNSYLNIVYKSRLFGPEKEEEARRLLYEQRCIVAGSYTRKCPKAIRASTFEYFVGDRPFCKLPVDDSKISSRCKKTS